MNATMPVWDLTYYAEDLGKLDTREALDELMMLAFHEDPVVREGVVYGLSRIRYVDGFRADAEMMLGLLELNDSSPGVRTAAGEALE